MTFRKDDEPHSVNIFKNTKSERPGYSLPEISCFRAPFGGQRVEGAY